MPHVSVVILNWNTTDNTLLCMEHLLASTYKDFEVIIVDNGSRPDELARLREAFGTTPRVKIVCNGTNRGFCEGNNIGFLNSDPAARWGLNLNGDTKLGRTWLAELVSGIERSGALGGTCTHHRGPMREFGTLSVTGFGGMFTDDTLSATYMETGMVETLYCSGAWFLFDKQRLGVPFPNDYFMYAEDVHLGMRIWFIGGKVVRYYSKEPEAIADHFGGHVLQKRRRQFAAFVGTRNRLTNMLYYYSPLTLLKILPLVLASQLAYTFMQPRLVPARIRAYCWIAVHPIKIFRRRKEMQALRKVPDSVLLRQQTCNMANDMDVSSAFARTLVGIANAAFRIYGRLVGLQTRDIQSA